MKALQISIMIPTYNQQKYIIRAIESALLQDYEYLEIVVSDDFSTDDTQTIVRKFITKTGDPRIKYFCNSTNLGILQNYKKTLYDYATGDWVINLDGDDFFIDQNFISSAISLAKEDPKIALVFANICEYSQKTSTRTMILNKRLPRIMEPGDFLSRYMNNGILWNHNSILYNRSKAMKIGFYWDEQLPMNDWESFIRLSINNRIGFIDKVSAAWVQHESNETRRVDLRKYLNNFVMIDRICSYASSNGINAGLLREFVKNMSYMCARAASIAYIRDRDYTGLSMFLNQVYKRSRFLPFKVIFDIGVMLRMLLSFSPSLYSKAKRINHEMKSYFRT